MLQSMTGFGRVSSDFHGKKVSCEVRALNSKSLDLNLRVAQVYKELEPVIRKRIAEKAIRGKIDFILSIDSLGDAGPVRINSGLAMKYYDAMKALNTQMQAMETDYMAIIMRMPDVLESGASELTEEESIWILKLVDQALDKLLIFRRKEGVELETEFRKRIGEIKDAMVAIPQYEAERLMVVRDRLLRSLEELANGFDPNRLEQEMIYYLEKLDVSEEKMRLDHHLTYFLDSIDQPEAGKKLGFIAQEMGREINTLGSKSNHAEMQKLVIGMKDALEKIKEQVMNTL